MSVYDDIEADWLAGNISYADACEEARELGYDDE